MTIQNLFGTGHTEFEGVWGPDPYDQFVSIEADGIIMMEIQISGIEDWKDLQDKANALLNENDSWRKFVDAVEKDASMSDAHKNTLRSAVATAMHMEGISIPQGPKPPVL